MAFFEVTIERIAEVKTHPNADTLDLVTLEGMSFQFVMSRDSVKPGDMVVYFPIDSVLPDKVKGVFPEAIVKKLAGKNHDRIKTVKLRDQIAQGLAFEYDKFPWEKFEGNVVCQPGYKVTSLLGVTKYDTPVIEAGGYNLHKLPDASPYYDIEGCERFPQILELLMSPDINVVITEKLEGRNSSVVSQFPGGKIQICQRSGEIVLTDENNVNITHLAAKKAMLPQKAFEISSAFAKTATIRGELLGHKSAQGDYYKLNNPEIHVFEIWLDGKPIDYLQQQTITDKFEIKTVPVLFIGKLVDFLQGRTIQEASNGMSVLNPKLLREGIVIRPMKELPEVPGFGRVFLKQRSPEYLAETKN